VWSDLAKNRTFRAISKAGFDESNFRRLRDVIMVSEPEAAALYTLKDLREQDGEESINVSLSNRLPFATDLTG
jgi:hypothetical protein